MAADSTLRGAAAPVVVAEPEELSLPLPLPLDDPPDDPPDELDPPDERGIPLMVLLPGVDEGVGIMVGRLLMLTGATGVWRPYELP